MIDYNYTPKLSASFSMYRLLARQWEVPFSRIILVSRHPLPNIVHSALRDCRDGMITWYKDFSSSDTHIDPFGASRIIWSTPWDTHSALQHRYHISL